VKADGRWRVLAFAGAECPVDASSGIARLCAYLADAPDSPVRSYTPSEADVDAVIDVRAVFQQSHRVLALECMPAFFLPRKGRYRLVDYEKSFCADPERGREIFEMRGIDRDKGRMVIIRPDQHVAHVLPLDAYVEFAEFFGGFMTSAS
jgi:phenol 2-monooxygenase